EDRPLYTMYPTVAWVALLTETQFDMRPHMEFPDWTEINVGIQQHLQKAYNTNKGAFHAQHWVIDTTIGTYNVEKIRRVRPKNITASEGRAQPLRSTRRSLTPSSWHTLLMGNSFGMRTDVYTLNGSGEDDEEGADHQDDEDEDGDGDTWLCYIWSFPGDMSPGNMCCRGTYFLTRKNVGPIVLLGIVLREGIPYEHRRRNDVSAETTATISTCKFL
nr:hypothetical protein [Tanacetum cinerariifolium]